MNTVFSFITVFAGLVSSAYGQETNQKVDHPFLKPQTSLVLGTTSFEVHLSNDVSRSTSTFNKTGIGTYGFDIEVNSTSFLNIGGYFRAYYQDSEGRNQDLSTQLSIFLGGFTRFFYSPDFLKSKNFIPNLFARLDLGAGPAIYTAPSGLLAQTGLHLGSEIYFNPWIGLGLSYGRVFEYGKETLSSGLDGSYNSTFVIRGQVIQFYLKTTFF